MKNKLYIHIGFHKCGTSFLQKFLRTNRNALLYMGINYINPSSDILRINPGHDGHIYMCPSFYPYRFGRHWSEYKEYYFSQLFDSKCMVNILSSESFIFDSPSLFDELIDKFDIKIIMYFRNVFDLISSEIKEIVKSRIFDRGLLCFREKFARNDRMIGNVEQFITKFGFDNCIFKNYDYIAQNDILLKDFCATIGIDFSNLVVQKEKVNITPPDYLLMFLYQFALFPISIADSYVLAQDILSIKEKKFSELKFNFLSKSILDADDDFLHLVERQAQLLNDDSWISHTLSRKDFYSSLKDDHLNAEIQHFLYINLSDNSKDILSKFIDSKLLSDNNIEFLYNINDIPENYYKLISRLRGDFCRIMLEHRKMSDSVNTLKHFISINF